MVGKYGTRPILQVRELRVMDTKPFTLSLSLLLSVSITDCGSLVNTSLKCLHPDCHLRARSWKMPVPLSPLALLH